MEKKVLIIEDEPDVAEYLKIVLESHGYRTYVSLNAQEAIEKVKDIIPDIICLDIMMPRQTGISFYTRLKKMDTLPKIPVIIVSGVIQQGEFDFRSFVPDKSIPPPECFIEKPIVIEDFIKTIEQLTAADTKVNKGG